MARGNHLQVYRGGYWHHGIDVGNGQVIHHIKGDNSWSKCIIDITSKEEFLKGREKEVVQYISCFSDDEVVDRAYSRLYEEDYGLVLSNCEHFARWCKTGNSESKQVNAVITLAESNEILEGVIGLPIIALALGEAIFSLGKKIFD